ncbi:hypothetical protein Dsin_022929 [Dipteronia sinensis]|uniref:J domain-containing protein n=1 Tax=Dipteronia sinensis TaxID=43782 RepID=A0AAE0A3F0_9ROSI|nr:hypothetical protein Dsin_022929 [Dipteronia sinensis]
MKIFILIWPGLYTLGIALFKNPNHPKAIRYFNAYLTHAILEITDYRRDIKGIKKAYMFKALLFHPDKCSSIAAQGATKLINIAWQVLSDLKRRQEYDKKLRI